MSLAQTPRLRREEGSLEGTANLMSYQDSAAATRNPGEGGVPHMTARAKAQGLLRQSPGKPAGEQGPSWRLPHTCPGPLWLLLLKQRSCRL